MYGTRRDRKEKLRMEAEERNQKWASLSNQEQLKLLPKEGATKQRARILKKIG